LEVDYLNYIFIYENRRHWIRLWTYRIVISMRQQMTILGMSMDRFSVYLRICYRVVPCMLCNNLDNDQELLVNSTPENLCQECRVRRSVSDLQKLITGDGQSYFYPFLISIFFLSFRWKRYTGTYHGWWGSFSKFNSYSCQSNPELIISMKTFPFYNIRVSICVISAGLSKFASVSFSKTNKSRLPLSIDLFQ
jgi:hypothetical protein